MAHSFPPKNSLESEIFSGLPARSPVKIMYGRSQEAVTETIRICKDRDVLRKFLAGREKEVISIMMALFDEEKIMRTHIASEKKAASKETARKAAEKMLRDRKITVDEITEYFSELSAEDIQEIEKELFQTI